MNETSPTRLFMLRGAFALLVLVILFFHLLPQQMLPRSWAGPEWVTLFAFAWSVRRPELVPPLLLGGLLLLSDLLLGRPPGLWAVLALIGAERLKARADVLRDNTLAQEFFEAALTLIGISLAYQLILTVLFIDDVSATLATTQALASVLCYPLAVLVTHVVMRVRKPVPGDLDTAGGRL